MCAKKEDNSINKVSWKDVSLTLKDGIELSSRIWLPGGEGGGPWPTLLMRQPYGKELASTITYAHPTWWASHGYLVIVQDVRGQGSSKGEFRGFSQEASDTTQTHAWVRSLPECNGKLGTFGFSYQGLTQLIAEPATRPPDCLAPAMTGLSERDHWSCDGKAYWWHLGLSWGIQLAALKARRNGDKQAWEKLRTSLENGSYLRDGPSLLKDHDPKGMAIEWFLRSNESNQNWPVHKPLKTWLKKPMLLIGGWWDPHLRGVIDLYQKSTNAGGHPELHIGPATHLKWWVEAQHLQLSFFNRHLKQNQPSKPQVSKRYLWNQTTEEWQSTNNSKLQTNKSIPIWGLESKGLACIDLDDGNLCQNRSGSGFAHLVHDPWRPVPSIGGHLSPIPGKADRTELDKRTDIATFTSPPFNKSIQLEGIPSLELFVESDQKGFDLCVALSVINRTQTKVDQLSTGVIRVLGSEAMQPLSRKVELQPILAQIKKGEHIRISIAGAAWPAIGINPGNDSQLCGSPDMHCNAVTLKMNLSQSKLQFFPIQF